MLSRIEDSSIKVKYQLLNSVLEDLLKEEGRKGEDERKKLIVPGFCYVNVAWRLYDGFGGCATDDDRCGTAEHN